MSDGGLWTPALTQWVDAVTQTWHAHGVSPDTITQLRKDLIRDLAQARRDGASVSELASAIPSQFAADVAAAEGLELAPVARPTRRRRTGAFRVIDAGLAGAITGFALSLVTVYPLGFHIESEINTSHPDPWALTLLMHVFAAALTLIGAAVAVRIVFRHSPNPRRVAIATTVGLALSGVIATVATMSYAASTDFDTATRTVVSEVLLVLAICAVGLTATTHLLRKRNWLDGATPL